MHKSRGQRASYEKWFSFLPVGPRDQTQGHQRWSSDSAAGSFTCWAFSLLWLHTVFFFPTLLWVCLSFLPVPFLSVSVPHCGGAQDTPHFTQRVTTLFVKPWLSGFRTFWLVTTVISISRLSPCLVIGNGVRVLIFLKVSACHVFNSAIKSMIKARSDLGLYHVL